MKKCTICLLTWAVLLAFTWGGCQISNNSQPQNTQIGSTVTLVKQPPISSTVTNIVLPGKFPTPSATATATLTPTPTKLPTATKSPTATYAPTTILRPTNTPYPQLGAVLSPENAAQIRSLTRLGKGRVNTLVYSPDGHYLIAGTSIGIAIYDTDTWSETFIELENSVVAVNFSPKGDILGVGLANGIIQLLQVPEWSVTQTLVYSTVEALVVHKNYWQGLYQGLGFDQNVGDVEQVIVFSPDGSLLVSGGTGIVKFYQVTDGTLQKTIMVDGGVYDIAFSPDGKSVVISAWDITLWQIPNWKKVYQFEDYLIYYNRELFDGIVFSADGNSLIGWSGQMIVFWQLSDGKVTKSYKISDGWGSSWNFSLDGKTLAIAYSDFSGSGEGLVIWDIMSATKHHLHVDHPDLISHLALSPDNTLLAASFEDGRLQILDISNNATIQTIYGFPSHVDDIELLPNGLEFVSVIKLFNYPILQTWNIAEGLLLRKIDLYIGITEKYRQIVFSPDKAKFLVTGKNLQLWDFASGRLLRTFTGEKDYFQFNDIIFAPDGTNILYSIWDKENFAYFKVILAYFSGDIIQTFEPAEGPICVLNDGNILLTRWHGVQYWSIKDGKLIKQILFGNYGPLLYFSPGCDVFAMMSWDGFFRVLQNANEQYGVPVNKFDLRASNIYLLGPVAFSPNRNLVAVQEAIGKIRIFNLLTGKTVSVLNGHKDRITSLNFTLDGKLLVSSSMDGTIRVWGISH